MDNHKPRYCKDCKTPLSFERFPERDAKTEKGKVILECWKCKDCGHIAWGTARW